MVYGTYNIITIVTGANLNQLKTGGPHIVHYKIVGTDFSKQNVSIGNIW